MSLRRKENGLHVQLDHSTTETSSVKHGKLFNRLQALFPPSSAESTAGPSTPSTLFPRTLTVPSSPVPAPVPDTPSALIAKEPDFIKIKIVTWNMHDGLPKGDLTALLGAVPPYEPLKASGSAIPQLPNDNVHPYHIVVVAGQECPTLSGIPMGLGANFKDRHKDRDKQHEPDGGRKEKERERHRKSKEIFEGLPAGQSSSWSWILEDWFQNGLGAVPGAQPTVPESPLLLDFKSPPVASLMESSSSAPAEMTPSSREAAPSERPSVRSQSSSVSWRVPTAEGQVTLSAEQATEKTGGRMGPYVLLTKERLMGIYMAIFVHRDCRKLLQGHSQATVTAGLMGGRMGNKGGCGISLNLAGTRLMFINAHLAAHEGKASLRLANLNKIKTELEVNSFLPPNDPRLLEEDVTERFDHTFLCGDLNFRLDVSRLHADWLIAHRDYAQALEFDQLRDKLKTGEVDFEEADIDFPPTYKYDVRRRSVREAVIGAKRPNYKRSSTTEFDRESEEALIVEKDEEDDDHDDGEPPRDMESASFVSSTSAWTSAASTAWTTDVEDDSDDDGGMAAPLAAAAQKLFSHPAAQKAKSKVMDLLQGRPPSPLGKRAFVPPVVTPVSELPTSLPSTSTRVMRPTVMVRSASSKTKLFRGNQGLDDEDFRNSYDSSSKKRVPSWCDRILWKTTVSPEPEPGPEHIGMERRGSFRAGYFGAAFASALRNNGSLSKLRRDSASTTQASHEGSPGLDSDESHSLPSPLPSPSPPLSRDVSFSSADAHRASARDRHQHHSLHLRRPGHFKSATAHPSLSLFDQIHSPSRRSSQPLSTPSSPVYSSVDSLPPRLPPIFVDEPVRSTAITIDASQVPARDRSGAARRWFMQIPGLLSRSSIHESTQSGLPPSPKHRRGDVVCLSYNTLDNTEMRMLDARSDHRPVIGSYTVYI